MSIFFFALVVAVAAADDDLTINSVFKPEGCDEARKSKSGDQLYMHYTGTIDKTSPTGEPGKQFDSSVGLGPFDFALGSGQVIKGWDEGLVGMCVGEKRELIISAEKGYGDRGAGVDIPGGATLNFQVECLDIQDEKPMPNIFADIDKSPLDGKLTEAEITAWFKETQNQDLPEGLMENEDKNADGFVSWEEFSGPKGSEAPKHEEL